MTHWTKIVGSYKKLHVLMASKYNIRKTLIDTLKSWSEGANQWLFLSSTSCCSTIAAHKQRHEHNISHHESKNSKEPMSAPRASSCKSKSTPISKF